MGKPKGTPLRRELIVVGASAGGIAALCELAASFPPDLPAAVLVGNHFPASSPEAVSSPPPEVDVAFAPEDKCRRASAELDPNEGTY